MKPVCIRIDSPHRSRRIKSITAIVIHYTGSMTLDGCISFFTNPRSMSSAHYVISRDGKLILMVPEDEIAWHSGRSALDPDTKPRPLEPNVNAFSIGIELVGTMDSGFTDRQLASLYEVVAQIVVRYKIRPERIVGHCHVSPGRKIDPDGVDHQFPWSVLREIAHNAYRSVSRDT